MQTQEVDIKPNIKVFMRSDSEMLDEVMVVAYGTAKKSAFTGSASVIKSETLEKRQVSNLSNALSGTVSGVQTQSTNGQPGTSATVRIRGIGSMYASNNPLYVVDGIPYEGDISAVNSQDIESMTVLKDAAAAALYGARGANGVILVTTKKGKSGDTQISLDARWGVNSRLVKTMMYCRMLIPIWRLHILLCITDTYIIADIQQNGLINWPMQTCFQSWATKFIPYLMDNILLAGTAS